LARRRGEALAGLRRVPAQARRNQPLALATEAVLPDRVSPTRTRILAKELGEIEGRRARVEDDVLGRGEGAARSQGDPPHPAREQAGVGYHFRDVATTMPLIK
jgi:hypothetical protein